MLNPFPDLLVLGFFAPTVLRVAIACVFACIAWRTWSKADHLGRVALPFIGARAWAPYLAGSAETLLAFMFLVGWYTQIAALIGILGTIKYVCYKLWWPRMLEEYYPMAPWTVFLMSAICLSLLLSGAGALALDLPL